VRRFTGYAICDKHFIEQKIKITRISDEKIQLPLANISTSTAFIQGLFLQV
jgi:hypothetical protein